MEGTTLPSTYLLTYLLNPRFYYCHFGLDAIWKRQGLLKRSEEEEEEEEEEQQQQQ